MEMFCYQCQETAKNQGCTKNGVCGKSASTARLQDLLVYATKGFAYVLKQIPDKVTHELGTFIMHNLFVTITNANFDDTILENRIKQTLEKRDSYIKQIENNILNNAPDAVTFNIGSREEMDAKAKIVGILETEQEDCRSLKELIMYGLKGIAAYAHHAGVLGFHDKEIYHFMNDALATTISQDVPQEKLIELVMETGKQAVNTMSLLDKANTECYGNPELTEVKLGVGSNPGILISGHDLKDLEELLEQTQGTGIDVYTHSEMLPAHYYPAFKKYKHLKGNYGNAWWKQKEEFATFNGPILMTTNCIVPVQESYADRIYTTGAAGYPNVKHIQDRGEGTSKDFSEIINHAKLCKPPEALEDGILVGGFAHHQVLQLADKVVEAVKAGAIKRFIVMAGCDGRQPTRKYFTEVAESLPKDTIILTAGCAKYRYNKLPLGEIGGIPRVLDAGQCNDSYSLAVIALKLKEVFALEDINELPISFDIAWYEQKAVAVLLALLHLGVKKIRLGPTLPAFISPTILNFLVEQFDIKPTDDVQTDINAMLQGK